MLLTYLALATIPLGKGLEKSVFFNLFKVVQTQTVVDVWIFPEYIIIYISLPHEWPRFQVFISSCFMHNRFKDTGLC